VSLERVPLAKEHANWLWFDSVFGISIFRLIVILKVKVVFADLGHMHGVNIIWW